MRRPNSWLHDRDSFFKYTTLDAVLKILESRSLRWSSPEIFNDPFDMQFNFQIGAKSEDIQYVVLNYLRLALSYSGGIPPDNLFGQSDQFRELIDELTHRVSSATGDISSRVREAMKGTKVICLSESVDSVLMWSHYTQSHRGVALELACIPEIDSVWGAAMPVSYSDAIPSLFDREFLDELFSGKAHLRDMDVINKFVTTKAKAWAYEREWRVASHLRDQNQPIEDICFDPRELAAIYLGCSMRVEQKEAVSAKIRRDYPKTKIYEAERMKAQFAIEFHER